MPYGFKFESEENILKSLELSKNIQRKAKQKVFLQEPKIRIKPMKSPLNDSKKIWRKKNNHQRPQKIRRI